MSVEADRTPGWLRRHRAALVHVGTAATVCALLLAIPLVAQQRPYEDHTRAAAFGWPIAWIRQDQSSLDANHLTAARFRSPYRFSTDVQWSGVLANLALATALAIILWFAVRALLRRAGGNGSPL